MPRLCRAIHASQAPHTMLPHLARLARPGLVRRCFSAAAAAGPTAEYERRIEAGDIVRDAHQVDACAQLQVLHDALASYAPPSLDEAAAAAAAAAGGDADAVSPFSSFAQSIGLAVGGGSDRPSGASGPRVSSFGAPAVDPSGGGGGGGGGWLPAWLSGAAPPAAEAAKTSRAIALTAAALAAPRGLYLHGGVGTGKTFVMDLFFDSAPADLPKQRVHFNVFMLDVHQRLHDLKQRRKAAAAAGDPEPAGLLPPITQVARDIMADGWLVCFDEFQVRLEARSLSPPYRSPTPPPPPGDRHRRRAHHEGAFYSNAQPRRGRGGHVQPAAGRPVPERDPAGALYAVRAAARGPLRDSQSPAGDPGQSRARVHVAVVSPPSTTPPHPASRHPLPWCRRRRQLRPTPPRATH